MPRRYDTDLARAAVAAVLVSSDTGDQLALAARWLADLLVRRAPGRGVELRVPPYVAVQFGDGPRHTRGTPGSVVETDPRTWVALATGRLTWADALASGAVRASGRHADLSALLPLSV